MSTCAVPGTTVSTSCKWHHSPLPGILRISPILQTGQLRLRGQQLLGSGLRAQPCGQQQGPRPIVCPQASLLSDSLKASLLPEVPRKSGLRTGMGPTASQGDILTSTLNPERPGCQATPLLAFPTLSTSTALKGTRLVWAGVRLPSSPCQ